MSASDSKKDTSLDTTRSNRQDGDRLSLSALRSQFTNSATQSLEQTELTSARFRKEERLRADIRRERRLRQQAINERVIAMQENLAKDLAVQHEMTLDALEKKCENKWNKNSRQWKKRLLLWRNQD